MTVSTGGDLNGYRAGHPDQGLGPCSRSLTFRERLREMPGGLRVVLGKREPALGRSAFW